MKYYYDMHIHSVLSPCGDYLMTPNNILNMAMLNELDIIAVTDHNTMYQLNTIRELQPSFDFLVVYGCELQVEGGHILIYFKSIDEANHFQLILDTLIEKESYDKAKYGEQCVCNSFDETVLELDYYLNIDLNCSLHRLLEILDDYDCIKVLAHLDRTSFSLIDKIDETMNVDAVEVVDRNNLNIIYEKHPFLRNKFVFTNSDAHIITDMNEKKNCIELNSLSVESLFEVIRND